jgi:4-amino-4-deoxy-L-arabinose transferase-like glycosyltransferase
VSARRALWLVVLGALAMRVTLLLARGDYIVYDEGYYLLLARSLRAGQGFALNGLPHVALSPLQPVLVALVSAAGVPDLWASRLLAAVCGSLLVLPVAALGRRAGGPRVALAAAVFTAASPALMSFVPFFPGERWNLYFGSEPLFLLLAFGAVAVAARASEGSWKWWLVTGLLAGGSYLARAEGAVLAGTLLLALALSLALRRRGATWRYFALATCAAVLVVAPYLLYLHATLGRWAVSGRVQAAAEAGEEAPSAVLGARSGGQVLEAFVWQGRPDAFLQALYGLDPSGTRMASQYWGVHRETARAPAPRAPASGPAASAPAAGAGALAARVLPRRGEAEVWRQGLAAVVPWWLGAVALAGLALGSRAALGWVFPLAACALLPSLLTYVEPRSLLPLAPLAAVYAAVAVMWIAGRVERTWKPAPVGIAAVAALALLAPAVRDLVRAWPQTTPLQQVATARRVVGEYLAQHLPADAVVMSWHPAVAVWASRPWRVLPFASFERITDYARGEKVAAIVFSRFEPSPLPQPPRAFTIVLPDGGGTAAGSRIEVQPIDETPLLFVGRLARVPGPAAP